MSNQARALKRLLNGRPQYSDLMLPPEQEPEAQPPARRKISGRSLVLNLPLFLGLLIVTGLFLVTLFGPLFAPENPYLVGTTTLTMVDGELQSPPFPPSPEQPLGSDPWGRDILSLLLYGTRNTLVACTFITMARVILGTILGIIAGWNEGQLSDRAIMGTVGITTSLPLLLTGMILIFALDIRRGITVFLIALCLVGWGEIAQYIRGEFLVLRKRPFIEGARAMGLTGPSIAIRHVLPNILPALIVITLLEMGATLMLMGELGFVGVFMGGGTAQENIFQVSATIPDIPEWGAMMADSRVWARGRPWMVFYPALAFFLAVLGFNTLGEGLRRLIERSSVNTAVLLSKRMLAVVAMIVLATVLIIRNVGPAPSYARLAQNFDGAAALGRAQQLAQLDRRVGSPGHEAAAEYIAQQFAAYGMQPAGGGRSFFQTINTTVVMPTTTPRLALLNEAGQVTRSFDHQIDFGFRIDGHGGSGTAKAPVTIALFSRLSRALPPEVFQGMDLREQVVLVRSDNAPQGFATEALIRGAAAMLVIEDGRAKGTRDQVQFADLEADYVRKPTLPILAINQETAAAILEAGGSSLDQLEASIDELPSLSSGQQPWLVKPLSARVEIDLALGEPQATALRNVLGYYPGQDVALDRELVIISAHYDSLGSEPDGQTRYDGANDGTSGVAILLEIARLWHEQGYTPRRTVLFAAFSGSQLTHSGAQYYVEGYGGPVGSLVPVAGFNLSRLGAGGDALEISESPQVVANLLERSADSLQQPVVRGAPARYGYQDVLSSRMPMLIVQRVDSDVDVRQDTVDRLSAELLQSAGEVLNLALIQVSRDANW